MPQYQVQFWNDDTQRWENKGEPLPERAMAESVEPELWDADFMTRVVKIET